ncbi:cupin domain-containing protein [Pseudonocardia sp. DSM 110487]|uniref:cupin domain-containing protein n=1 Tax=Pseudonocardia sp. DSM 110487 TaxID=2865833 RepID=UPI001C6A4E6F|nr:cupin domain-containing protein [Pseudonocardia sp. DSM 110487]QYN39184.1 cupin domain-containing protein [Pseudonocardia sp. DSM 110487]
METELGARLRAERLRQGLSLRALAQRVGVSASMLSQVEIGRSRASVSTLYAVVEELGLSMDALFAREGAGAEWPDSVRGEPVVRSTERSRIVLDTGVVWERLAHLDPGELEFLEATYPAGSTSGASGRFSQHTGLDCCYVLSGQLTLHLGFEAYELGVGDSAAFDATRPHKLENTGTEDCRALWFIVHRSGRTWPGNHSRSDPASGNAETR